MNTARVRPTDALTGAAGAVLLVSLFIDWYSLPQGGVSAWGAFAVLDLLLALVALLALLVPVVTGARETPAWPVAALVLATALAFLAAVFLLYRLLDQPGPDGGVGTAAGLWLGSLALLAVFVSSARALRDERSPGIPGPGEIPVMPAPPRQSPGAGAAEGPA